MLEQAAELELAQQQDMEDIQSTAGLTNIQANFQIAKGAALKVADAVEKVLLAAMGASKARHDTSCE